MTRIPLPVLLPGTPTHDNTMMSAYAYCQRLYALQHFLHRKTLGKSAALGFGGLMHVGLDHYYRTLKPYWGDRDGANVVASLEAALTAMDANLEWEDPVDDYRTRERAMTVMMAYAKKYQMDQEFNCITFTETASDIIHPGNFPWGGIIDLCTEYAQSEWPVDHKTTSQFNESTQGQSFYDDLKRAPQMMGYAMNMAALRGVWPSGVIINTIVVRATSHFFHRKPITYPMWLIQEWQEMQTVNYSEIVEKRAVTNYPEDVWNPAVWKPNFYNCVGKYGRCSMYDICHSQPENRERVLANETEEKEWDWRTVRE